MHNSTIFVKGNNNTLKLITMENLIDTINDLGFTFSKNVATTNSIYYVINGIKFRISDHDQPSHYQIKNYFDVVSENDIINIIKNELFTFKFNPYEYDGKFFDMVYNDSTDQFKKTELSEEEFISKQEKLVLKEEFFNSNNFKK